MPHTQATPAPRQTEGTTVTHDEGSPRAAAQGPRDLNSYGEELPGTWSIPGTQWAPGDNMDFQATLQQLANDGKPLEFVDFHGESGYLPYWENWAARTGGEAEAASTGELVKELVTVAEAGASASLPPCPADQVRNAEEQCVVVPAPVVPPPVPVPAPQPSIYVALGDSYSSGEGVPPFETGSNTRRDKCHRSSRAYAELLKGTRAFPATLKFAACSGARIANFYPGKGQYGEKGQLADLSAQDSVVSLTAGGNDVLFGKFIESCVLLPACYLTDDLPVRALIKHTIKRLPKLYREVLRRAPKAQAYVLGYPHLFSPRPSLLCNGIDRLEAAWITRMEDLLNGGIRSAVDKLHESRLHFVDTADAFAGGELCSKKKPVYLNGIIKAHLEYSFHPTAAGQRRLAEVLAKAVRKG